MPDLSPIQQARFRVSQNRNAVLGSMAEAANSAEANQTLNAVYQGYKNGVYWARLPNGGTLQFTPASNGSLPIGSAFQLQRHDGTYYGYWMPH